MANTGRTVSKYNRLYLGNSTIGLDLSCNTMSVGEAGIDFDVDEQAAYCWEVKGGLPDRGNLTLGPVNMSLNAGTAELHDAMVALEGSQIAACLAVGIREAPTYGSPAFLWQGSLKSYQSAPAGGMVMATATLSGDNAETNLYYSKPWGVVVHPLGTETAQNTATAGTIIDNGAPSANGGYLFYDYTVLDGTLDNTVAILEESADAATWSTLILQPDIIAAPAAGIIQLAPGSTVKRYLRWQLAFDAGTTATFLLAFVRG